MFFNAEWRVHFNSDRASRAPRRAEAGAGARTNEGIVGLPPPNAHGNTGRVGAIDFTGRFADDPGP